MPSSSLLVLSSDAASADHLAGLLTGVGYGVTKVADPDEAFRQAGEHGLVIVDVVAAPKTPADVVKEIRATPALAAVPVLCIGQSDDVEERISLLESGADDTLAKPFDTRELEARVEALLLRFARTKDLAPVFTSGGSIGQNLKPGRRIVAVFSPKGGAGTTTIAVNIALAQAQKTPDRVVIVDLDLQFGQVATHLNLEVRQSLVEVIRDDAALRESELLRTYAIRHDAGLHLLAAPPTPEFADAITLEHIGRMLAILPETYDTIVIDAGSTLDERTLHVFERADTVILPVYPEIAALKAVRGLLDYLIETGSVSAKAFFVLNGMFAKEILRQRDVESALGSQIGIELPYDPFLYLKAVNEGIPVVRGAPKSSAAERLTKLATTVFGEDGTAAGTAAAGTEKRSRGLGGLLRRS